MEEERHAKERSEIETEEDRSNKELYSVDLLCKCTRRNIFHRSGIIIKLGIVRFDS